MHDNENRPLPTIESLGIFQNQEEVAKNIKLAAEAIGVEINEKAIEKLADEKPFEVRVAKKNCNWCHGRGVVDFAPNKNKKETNTRLPQFGRIINDFVLDSIEDSDAPFPSGPKTVKAMCKCVRVRLE